jgi:hypothetical protein
LAGTVVLEGDPPPPLPPPALDVDAEVPLTPPEEASTPLG